MASSYTINLTDGTVLAVVAPGTLDAEACDIILVGKNFKGYGEVLNEDLVHILENFSRDIPPNRRLL